jgi:hypothetical protein
VGCETRTTLTKTARINVKTPDFHPKVYSPTKTDTQNHRLQLKFCPDLSMFLELIIGSENRGLNDIRGPTCVSDGTV